MKRILSLSALLVLVMVQAANAELSVTCDVEEVSRHELLVTLAWKVTARSDKKWDACDLAISFKDKGGNEVFQVKERMVVKIGMNRFSGHEICDTETWSLVRKYVASFDCVF